MKIHYLLIFLLVPLLFSCQKDNNTRENAVAAILYNYTGLDGCSWVVDIEDGTGICEIAGWPDTGFEAEDGKKVWVTYELSDSQISICMVGPRVNITGMWERE